MRDLKTKTLRFNYLTSFAILLLVVVFAGFNHLENYEDILSEILKKKDNQKDVVLFNNQSQIIPFKDLTQKNIASVNMGNPNAFAFDDMLRNYASVTSFDIRSLKGLSDLKTYNTIIFQVTPESVFSADVLNFLHESQQSKDVIIAGFGHTGALQKLDGITAPLLWNPAQSQRAAQESAQIIFGGIAAQGKLLENVSPHFYAGAGDITSKIRLKYAQPEELGISSQKLSQIDNIIYEAIRQRATPSAVVMVVKDGAVIFNKAYGSHTYDGDVPASVNDIYDLASVTKTAATTVAAMKLYEQQKLDLNSAIGTYLPDVKYTNKSNIPVKDVLLHQAGFVNLDFFGGLRSSDHSSDSSFFFPVKAADHYYLRRDYYKEVMWPKMLRTPLPTRGQYVYSDISMYMMKEIIEHQAGKSLDKFVSDEFYKPLGMRTAGFNPLNRFPKDKIVPTERDTYFRKTLLQGYVHDSGASMANGVSGHAGLFASANDLAILNQMLLNGGSYGGIQYLHPETVELFTASQSRVSRRGYGFDRSNGSGYPSSLASKDTYGHTGYTGTAVWVDPQEKLIYIFLSNRVYPSASTKLNSLRIRPRVQDAIYEAIREGNRSVLSVSK